MENSGSILNLAHNIPEGVYYSSVPDFIEMFKFVIMSVHYIYVKIFEEDSIFYIKIGCLSNLLINMRTLNEICSLVKKRIN